MLSCQSLTSGTATSCHQKASLTAKQFLLSQKAQQLSAMRFHAFDLGMPCINDQHQLRIAAPSMEYDSDSLLLFCRQQPGEQAHSPGWRYFYAVRVEARVCRHQEEYRARFHDE